LVRAHVEAKKAWDLGATEAQMADILNLIRHAQWRWDYVAASHGASFHSPVEVSRIISSGITRVQESRIKLARLLSSQGFMGEVPYPDISSKSKAQEFIGLDMKQLNSDKKIFIEKVIPEWIKQGQAREAGYPVKNNL